MREFVFEVENRPGALARVASSLGDNGINIEGIAGIGAGEVGLIHLVTDDPGRTGDLLRDLGIEFEEREAFAVEVLNRPGELGAVLKALANEGINVESCYAGVEANELILAVDKLEEAKRVLKIA
jgi:hypothetical protein